jgi:hypothetical protein
MKPATPLPWVMRETYDNGEPNTIILHPAEFPHNVIAETDAATDDDYADSVYIVHACNLYPKLVEALKDALWAMEDVIAGSEDLRCLPVKGLAKLLAECGEG